MNSSSNSFHASLIDGLRAKIAPLIEQVLPLSSALPLLADAENKRLAAVRQRLAEVDCEIEEIEARRNANARQLASRSLAQEASEPSISVVNLPFINRRKQS
jgi:hypothetical protein